MATSDTTRLLVLGVTQLFGPANGYQLRRELLSWNVQEWAHINPGSIYSMLATLTKHGLVERSEVVTAEGANPVAVLRTTPEGDSELKRMVSDGLTEVHPFERTEFYAAASLMVTLLERDEIAALLERRIANLRAGASDLEVDMIKVDADTGTPPHVGRLMDYSVQLMAAEAAWLGGFVDDIRSGAMTFLNEPDMAKWKPADDDPAWQMVAEREKYLRALKG